jgi:hypothetical protein
MALPWHGDCIVGGTSDGRREQARQQAWRMQMHDTTDAQAGSVQPGMEVYGADGQPVGTVERVSEGAFFAAGRRLANDAIQRIEAGHVHLFGDSGTYAVEDGGDEAAVQRERSKGLPNTDAPLFVNEREVEASLEERLPRDGER